MSQQSSTTTNNFKLNDPPTDGITRIQFSPTQRTHLAVSSWDSNTRLYDTSSNTLIWSSNKASGEDDGARAGGAVLDVCFSSDGQSLFTGGLDCKITQYFPYASSNQPQQKQAVVIGSHEKAVRCVVAVPNHPHMVLSGSWDESIKLWDARLPNVCLASTHLSKKVFSMDVTTDGSKLIVGTNERQIFIYHLSHTIRHALDMVNSVLSSSSSMSADSIKKLEFKLLQHRMSALKYQTRCIRCHPDGQGYVLSSIEGRVAVEYIDPSEAVQSKKYAFKCHRTNVNGVDTLYPVNAIAFHPKYGTFATGGGDGVVNVWDGLNKKRIVQYPKYPSSIASLSFNNDGTLLAIASSYTFEQGELSTPTSDDIYIRQITDNCVLPKTK